MPSPGAPAPSRLPVEDSYLELLADTLESLDIPARGQFLQRYFRAIVHLELRESQCIQLWDEMLVRRKELSEHVGRPVALKTALMDVLASAGLFRVPIVIEYDELKTLQVNAVTDPLTGLYNRRLFSESFEKELNRARRYGLPMGLVILDLHRFKEVNDRHGHPKGDDVLRAAATTLKKALRTSDSAFRIGGDEFALLLPQTDPQQALALSHRVETVFVEVLQTLSLGFSVNMDHGVATFPEDGDQPDQLIHVADERLYRVKHAEPRENGGNRAADRQLREAQVSSAPASNGGETGVIPPSSAESKSQRKRSTEKASPALSTAAAASAASIARGSTVSAPAPSAQRTEQRKAERVSMSGTNAYALIGDAGTKRARVLDLGFGGVALELEAEEKIPESMAAILHVPILPPVRVSLRPVWSQTMDPGGYRIGFAFVS